MIQRTNTLPCSLCTEPTLEVINQAFTWETAECVITGRVEAYSCKLATREVEIERKIYSQSIKTHSVCLSLTLPWLTSPFR